MQPKHPKKGPSLKEGISLLSFYEEGRGYASIMRKELNRQTVGIWGDDASRSNNESV